MPIYEYICSDCNEKFALLQSVYPQDNTAECPKCLSKKVKKAISTFSCGTVDHSTPTGFGGGGG
ncbi:MAG: zinc ribbon domain-containing protein [Nitrospira sp.]|nr:zinc ribbon domain-containing protein [bacterium]MBL7048131.1 zinc ribbon domain-containing protein [Nitrospira sp.]